MTPAGAWRVPLYLRVRSELALAGLSLSVGLPGRADPIRFVAVEGRAPTLVDDNLPGSVAAAWLQGFQAFAGDEVLLGFVELAGPEELAVALHVYGLVGDSQRDGSSVPLAFPVAASRPDKAVSR